MTLKNRIKPYATGLGLIIPIIGLTIPVVAVRATVGERSCSSDARICGLAGPEDMVEAANGVAVIASRLGGRGLNVIDITNHRVSTIDPLSLPESPDSRYPCTSLSNSGVFVSHGLSIKPQTDGSEFLFVVRHGGREAIEIFRFSRPSDVNSLTWVGCVHLPKGFAGNAVAGRRDGGFYVTSMTDEGDAPGSAKLAKLYDVQPSGKVLGWIPTAGFQSIPIGTMSGPNGIELSPDNRWLYVDGWASREIVQIDLKQPGTIAGRTKVSFMPDNLHWTDDGRLVAAGVQSTPKHVYECAGTHSNGSPCATHWTIAIIDPTTMTLKSELSRDDQSGFGDVSVALKLGRAVWLGSFDGNFIAIEPYDSITASQRERSSGGS